MTTAAPRETHYRHQEAQRTPGTIGFPHLLAAGISGRHIDYWTGRGLLRTVTDRAVGIGNLRRYPPSELPVALLMERLTRAGVKAPAAEKIAREALRQVGGHRFPVRVQLAAGVWLEVSPAAVEPLED